MAEDVALATLPDTEMRAARLSWCPGVSEHQWNGGLAALRSRVEQGVVNGHGAEHAWRPAPAAAALAVRPHQTPDDDGDASVLRVEPALALTLRWVDDPDCCLFSEETHVRVSRLD